MIILTFYTISTTSSSYIETTVENISPRAAESLNNSKSAMRESWDCMTSYERKESVVQDTVYQQKCVNVTLPICHITHIQATRTELETRFRIIFDILCLYLTMTQWHHDRTWNMITLSEGKTSAGFEFETRLWKLFYFIWHWATFADVFHLIPPAASLSRGKSLDKNVGWSTKRSVLKCSCR